MGMDDLTAEEQQQLIQAAEGLGYPKQEEKQGIFQFFNKVLRTKDNTKAANIHDEELLSVRTLQNGALYCEHMKLSEVNRFFMARSQIVLAPTLSREGFLIKAAITTKKETSLETKERKVNTGWFKKKTPEQV